MHTSELNTMDTLVSITNDGEVRWFKKAILHANCKMDFKHFPYDEQHCPLDFISWSYNSNQLYLNAIPQEIDSFYQQDDIWTLERLETETISKLYSSSDIPFNLVTVTLHIRRRDDPMTINLVIPSALLSSLALLSFILPADSGERISLCITILLTVTLFQQLTLEMIPRSQMPYLSIYFFITAIASAVILVINAVIINLYFGNSRRMPSMLRKIVLVGLGKVFYKEDSKQAQKVKNGMQSPIFEVTDIQQKTNKTNLLKPGPIISKHDVIYADLISTMILNNKNVETNQSDNNKTTSRQAEHPPTPHQPEHPQSSNENHYDSAYMEHRKREWMNVCVILDRFFLLVFIVIFSIAFLLIIGNKRI